MGAIVKISCMSCDSQWTRQTGCGILHGTLSAVKGFFPERTRQKLDAYEADTELPMFDFGYRLAVCEGCGEVVSVPVIKLLDKGKEYTGVCEKCGGQAELIDNIGETKCPVCHKLSLSEEDYGFWD